MSGKSWEDSWKKAHFDVRWHDSIRSYVGLCQHYVCIGKHHGLLIGKTVQEMDKKISDHVKSAHVGRRRPR